MLSLVSVALTPACARPPIIATPDPLAAIVQDSIDIRLLRGDGDIVTVPLEHYVRGTVLAEVPLGSLPINAAITVAEVQAILARTYAVYHRGRHSKDGFDLCSTTHCQMHRETTGITPLLQGVIDRALKETNAKVIVYDGLPIEALFHADCGGATSSAKSVWGGPSPPYLNGVMDRFCLTPKILPWTARVKHNVLRDALNTDERTAVGSRLDNIIVTRRDAAGRAVELIIDGAHPRVTRGETIRTILTHRLDITRLKSTRFTIQRNGNDFVFTGSGHGHGAGLCQIGAMARARAGHTAARILKNYYPGTKLGLL